MMARMLAQAFFLANPLTRMDSEAMKSPILMILVAIGLTVGCDQASQLRAEAEDVREARQDEGAATVKLRKEVAELRTEMDQLRAKLAKAESGTSKDVVEQEQELRDKLTATKKDIQKNEAAVGDAKKVLE